MTPPNWSGKRVLVTGADGFIGSHLVEALLDGGARVVAMVRRTSRSQVTQQFQNLIARLGDPSLSFVPVDLAGPSAQHCLLKCECEYWFHLAADAYVPASFAQPMSVVTNNVESTLHVLEAGTVAKPRNVLITSSSEVYGPHDGPISEAHPLNPTSPYAASKVACDRLAWSYHQSFGTNVTIVRPFNTYGPRHIYDVVPLFVRYALAGKPLPIHGDGRQSRDLTYVTDQVAAMLAIGARPGRCEVFNIGTGKDVSVVELAKMIRTLAQSRSELVFGPPRLGEVHKLQADPGRVIATTGWRPLVSLENGLLANIEWARAQGWGA